MERPPPYDIGVGEHDSRHPQNVKAMISQQSSHDEHKSSLVNQMKEQNSDNSETDGSKKATASAGVKVTVVKQQAKVGAAGKGSAADSGLGSGSKLIKAPVGGSANQPGDTIHTLFTSNGSPYQNFQARIM